MCLIFLNLFALVQPFDFLLQLCSQRLNLANHFLTTLLDSCRLLPPLKLINFIFDANIKALALSVALILKGDRLLRLHLLSNLLLLLRLLQILTSLD